MSRANVNVREFEVESDLEGLRSCVVELQDAEQAMYSRLPPGTEVVAACISHMMARCEKCAGRIFVAEADGEMCGFVTVLTRVISEEPDDGELEYGLVSDLVVLESRRGLGIGRALLSAAETHARANDVEWLRIGVIAGNAAARRLYASFGFDPWYVELEKNLLKSDS